PLDTLERVRWQVVLKNKEPITRDTVEIEGQERKRQSITFQAEVQGVIIRKTFSLTEGTYHLGLDVALERAKSVDPKKELKFRYQLTSGHGLPIEGRWYTTTYRNALIAQEDDRGNIYRDIQELREISLKAGGNRISKQESKFFRYAGVAVQYFASMIVVDSKQDILRQATPTLETAVAKGTVESISAGFDMPALAASTLGLLAAHGH